MQEREINKKQREYNCPQCGKPLIEGLEHQFPPRLSFWCCSNCQQVFKEIDKGEIVAHAPVKGNERLCVQDDAVRGFIENTQTGKRSYPDDLYPDLFFVIIREIDESGN